MYSLRRGVLSRGPSARSGVCVPGPGCRERETHPQRVICGQQRSGILLIVSGAPVNVDNFARAESDRMFAAIQAQAGGVNQWYHYRTPTPLDQQTVIRMNRDTPLTRDPDAVPLACRYHRSTGASCGHSRTSARPGQAVLSRVPLGFPSR